ncbi:MAG: transglutaminase-like domain-containing protein [Bryobacteraceae bacterium]
MRTPLTLFLLVAGVIWPRERTVAVEYNVAVRGVPEHGRVELWVPVPPDDESQTVTGLRFTSPGASQVSGDALGNRYFYAVLAANGTIGMSFRATRRERVQRPGGPPAKGMDTGPDCCLGPDRLVPIDGKISTWASQVVAAAKAERDIEKARAIYNHVIATVKYDKSGKGWGRGDIYYACDARRGNCTDFHAIFIGYSRAVGVPARFAIGLPLPEERGNGEISGYHCWAEFFAKGTGWVPIDASEAAKAPARREYFFGAHDENRIEFSRGRDLVLSPPQRGEPLNFFIYPYAELDGKPFAGLETKITYRDIE